MSKFLIEVEVKGDERNSVKESELSIGAALADYVEATPGAFWVGDNRYMVASVRRVDAPAEVKAPRKRAAAKAAPAFSGPENA